MKRHHGSMPMGRNIRRKRSRDKRAQAPGWHNALAHPGTVGRDRHGDMIGTIATKRPAWRLRRENRARNRRARRARKVNRG